jgi:hypothetical protein
MEAETPSSSNHRGNIPLPTPSEAEILADVHSYQTGQVPSKPRQELRRLQRRERGIESLGDNRIDAEAQQERGFGFGVLQQRRGTTGTKDGARVRPESEHGGKPALPARGLHRGFDDGAVAEVNAIEHADR